MKKRGYWHRGCLERLSRCQSHDTDQPTSTGCVAAFILEAHRSLEYHVGVIHAGDVLEPHLSWNNGVGVHRAIGDYSQVGNFMCVLTGKGQGSSASFVKHFKQFQVWDSLRITKQFRLL